MSRTRFPRSVIALPFAAGTVMAASILAGCAPVDSAPADAAPAPTASDAVMESAQAVTDVESCEAFSDVLTILHNANVALHEERMTQKEFDGWMRLATRVLDRVPTNGTSEVSDAIQSMKEATPAVPLGATRATDLGTPEWQSQTPALGELCEASGFVPGAEGFIGG